MPEILKVLHGSHAYGTASEKSDVDHYSIIIPEIDYLLGLKSIKSQQTITEDEDSRIITLSFFIRQALKGKPGEIEILFTRIQDIQRANHIGLLLIENRQKLLSLRLLDSLLGFAHRQYKNCLNGNKNRFNLKLGYDPKAAYHVIRVLTMAVDFKATGTINTYIQSPIRRLICKEIKTELWPKIHVVSFIDSLFKEYEEIPLLKGIPESPDFNFWNQFVIDAHLESLKLNEKDISPYITP